MPLFDRSQLARNINRATPQFDQYDFLFTHAWENLADRLTDIRQNFTHPGVTHTYGARQVIDHLVSTGKLSSPPVITGFDADERLHAEPGTHDVLLSVFDLQTMNDLPLALAQCRFALTKGGVFLGAIIGGESLYALRQAITAAELELTGRASPRIHPMLDMPGLAALMQQTGWALPVIDHEIITVDYPGCQCLCDDLRGMGGGNIIQERARGLTPRGLLSKTEAIYRARQNIGADAPMPVTFDLIYLIGWADA